LENEYFTIESNLVNFPKTPLSFPAAGFHYLIFVFPFPLHYGCIFPPKSFTFLVCHLK